MLNQNHYHYNITLPQPVDCDCGSGKLVPIFRPAQLVRYRDNFGMAVSGQDCVQEGFNEVIWKCSKCGKEVR